MMGESTTQNDRLEQIFSAVLACSPDLRAECIRSHCGSDGKLRREIDSLVDAAEKAEGFLSNGPFATSWVGVPTIDAQAMLGQQFDSWQIIRELDSGGMGIVFLAERVDGHYQQQVAIKLAKLGLGSSETVTRFHTERQILANLQHPNIAQLLDGGTCPDGYPYLVMEYVRGTAIDKWCDSQRLSVEQILKLMASVCEAVQYAHNNLVVHCDLKPSNILVSEGVPKLLDFGIATLLSSSAGLNASDSNQPLDESAPITPSFAAPEQIRGESVTVATDVYALGIVLYRMLSGKYPYSITGRTRAEIANEISLLEITAPSLVVSSVVSSKTQSIIHGDLDSIVLKALQKDPRQRYSSVQDLLIDIKRYLAGFPVSVSPNSRWNRCRKFIKRHKAGATLSIITFLSLWIGGFVSIWQWQVAQQEQAVAKQRLEDVRKMINKLVVDLPKSIASQPASTPLRIKLLEHGIRSLDELIKSQTGNTEIIRELAAAYSLLGRLQGYPASANLGEPVAATVSYEKSLELQHQLLSQFPNDKHLAVAVATNYSALTLLYFLSLENSESAYEYARKCQALLQPLSGTGDPAVLRWLVGCHTLEAKWRSRDKEYLKSAESVSKAEKILLAQASNHAYISSYEAYRARARIHEEWAEIEANTGSKEQALMHERKRLDIALEHLQNDEDAIGSFGSTRITADAYHAYGERLAGLERFTEAEIAYSQAVDLWLSVSERFPSDASAPRSLVYIYADYAELHRRIGATLSVANAIKKRNEQACNAYEASLANLAKLPVGATTLVNRHSWSLPPQRIQEQYDKLCMAH